MAGIAAGGLLAATAAATGFQPPETIRAAALAALGGRAAGVEVAPQLRMPRCAQALQARAMGPASVEVRCGDAPGWRLFVPVRLQRGEAPPATAAEPGDAAAPSAAASGPPAGRRLPVFAPAAEPAGAELLRRGDPVVLVSRIAGAEVRGSGRALGPGRLGATVSVENVGSRRIIRGRVVAAGTVEVLP
ncbi:flagella basal body P-ring formation protein FlgA [Vulcaniibacterium tengchongense]|nr:flagella basal body P-ring formation protein FlgA [Vulcaniibacterium tengchongense]